MTCRGIHTLNGRAMLTSLIPVRTQVALGCTRNILEVVMLPVSTGSQAVEMAHISALIYFYCHKLDVVLCFCFIF